MQPLLQVSRTAPCPTIFSLPFLHLSSWDSRPPDLDYGPTCSSSPISATHLLELVSEQDPNTSNDPDGSWSHALWDPVALGPLGFSVHLLPKFLCDKVKLFLCVRNTCSTSTKAAAKNSHLRLAVYHNEKQGLCGPVLSVNPGFASCSVALGRSSSAFYF